MTLGIGVIGTGIMGADHVATITTAIAGAQVVAIADIDLQRAERIASRVPGAKALPSADSLIESAEVDGVIIASRDATHAQYVRACIAARKPVLCEKPLAPTSAECEEILSFEQAAGVRLVQVGFMRRFDPGYVELRQRIASGEIGPPVLAHCVHRNVDVPASWSSETTVFSSASHEIDVMPWVFGRDVLRVNWFSPIPLTAGSLCDPQVVVLELEGGALIFDELFVKSGYGYEIRCEVVGRTGTIELAPTARVVARSGLKVSEDFPPDWRGPLRRSVPTRAADLGQCNLPLAFGQRRKCRWSGGRSRCLGWLPRGDCRADRPDLHVPRRSCRSGVHGVA
jgi:myo-inositol 2-dehydrogenase / D-chiro-inositol 1-dehydrogenase